MVREMADVWRNAGNFKAALDALESARKRHPTDPELATDLAMTRERSGATASATALYDAIIAAHPNALRARINRAAGAFDRGDFETAMSDYDAVLAQRPGVAVALLGRAECLRRSSQFDAAIAACDELLANAPDHTPARLCRAIAMAMAGRYNDAQAVIDAIWHSDRAALVAYAGRGASDAERPDARSMFLLAELQRLNAADWSTYDKLPALCEALFSHPDTAPADQDIAFALLYLPASPRATANGHAAIAARYAGATPPRRAPLHAEQPRRLRIGYLSSCFRDHPFAYLSGGIYAAHDRARFEIFAYALNPDDGSEARARIVPTIEHFRACHGASDLDVVARMCEDELDILVEHDIYSDEARPAIAATRIAPLQVHWHGHMHSAYAPWFDYRLTSTASEPGDWGRPLVEKRVFIEPTFMSYDHHAIDALAAPSRGALGLAEDAFVLCAFARIGKICPTVFELWVTLLREIPQAVLWLGDCPQPVRDRLRGFAIERGVHPERLVFAAHVDHRSHVARHAAADIFLDTLRFNAHTTALDALHAGLPVVTCRGSVWSSRVGASFLAAVGLHELITDSPTAYRDLVLALARDRPRLAALRTRLAATIADHNPFACETHTARLERAYSAMWSRYQQGLEPADLRID